MRIDLYTKFVLTVIALCLVWSALGGPAILPAVMAQAGKPAPAGPAEKVLIAGWIDSEDKIHTLGNTALAFEGLPVAEVRPR
jgi:hypothetical protein